MKEMMIIAEHRRGELREVTWEMLSKGRLLAESAEAELSIALLGKEVNQFVQAIKPKADKIYLIEDEQLEFYNSETYEKALTQLITEKKPFLTIVGHTATGMDFAPSLAARLKIPLATDCIGIDLQGEDLLLTRQVFGGKVNTLVSFAKRGPYMLTVRPGAFPIMESSPLKGEMILYPSGLTQETMARRFLQYVEASLGEVDITQADILVSVGRGIKEAGNIPMIKEFADTIGGVLACSRPVVDKKWLPKACQVGSSGKTVRPKVYIAIGISGAFQHIMGMKGAGTVIAINKDPKAPIFSAAHYGIVGDLFKIVPVLKEKIKELKQK